MEIKNLLAIFDHRKEEEINSVLESTGVLHYFLYHFCVRNVAFIMTRKSPIIDDFEKPSTVWLEVVNQAEFSVLAKKKKCKKVNFFAQQRIFHPNERGLVTQGERWNEAFRIVLYSISADMKTKRLLKLTVNKMFRIIVSESGCSVNPVRSDQIDKQLCAYQRMEEVWDNSNYYETLRVSPDATQREIRVAYLKLAKLYHPDHNQHPQACLMFERITEAYHTLSDEEVRRQYDTHLRTDPGVLSKSYWRQLFCFWNRHKAFQVGISTLLCLTGGVVILTSILAAPSGAGLAWSIPGAAVGSGIFASGIGGLAVALSRQAALEGNKNYKRYLKYSFWYGLAGVATGAISGGVAGSLGVAVGTGMAAVAASGAVNGAIQGMCFGVGAGIASDRWIELIKKLRVDAIAMDLVVSTLTGAATGMVFQALLMTTAGMPSAIMGHAKFSAEQLAGNNGGTLLPQKTQHPKRVKILKAKKSEPLLLTYNDPHTSDNNNNDDKKINNNQNNIKSEDLDYINNDGEFENVVDGFRSVAGGINVGVLENDYFLSHDDDDSLNNFNTKPSNQKEKKEKKEEKEEDVKMENGNKSTDDGKKDDVFVPPEISEFLRCEENTIECINEAISLYEAVAHHDPQHFIIFYDHSRGKKVRMVIDYTKPKDKTENGNDNADDDELEFIREFINPNMMHYLPVTARFIQVHFEYSTVGILWEPLCSFGNSAQTFAYTKPVSRRFFIVGYSDETFHVSQIRDEYEQLVLE